MARLAHEHLDARKYARAHISLNLDRVYRRLAQQAEDYIAEKYGEAMARGLPFDHEKVGREAVQSALEMYNVKVGSGDIGGGAVGAGSKSGTDWAGGSLGGSRPK